MDIPEFGIKRENEERRDGGCAVIFDPQTQQYAVGKEIKNGNLRLFSGGFNKGEDGKAGVLREVLEESGLHDFLYIEHIADALTHYRNTLKNVNRVAHATCFLLILKSIDTLPLQLEEHEQFFLYWASAQELIANWESRNEQKDYDHWIYFFKKSVARAQALGYDTTNM